MLSELICSRHLRRECACFATPRPYIGVSQFILMNSTISYPKPEPPFYPEIPFDLHSVDAIAPIHPTMPYHLAHYHLNCAYQQPDTNIQPAFIPELSCSGIARFSNNGPEYSWSSEIYFYYGTFLENQEIDCLIDKGSNYGSIKFTECPHITLDISAPWFQYVDGFLVARTLLRFPRNFRTETFAVKWWNSKMGRFTRVSSCMNCHSDHE